MDEVKNDELTLLVESQLDAISDYVWLQKAPIWGDASGRIVDAKKVDELLDNVSTCLPEDIRCANSVLREAQNIKDRANADASQLRSDAERNAESIINSAKQEAQRITNDANRYRKDVTAEADEYNADVRSNADKYYADRKASGDRYNESRCNDGDAFYRSKVAEAEQEAADIIADAEAEAERLISESEIMRQANERAAELRRRTVLWANQVHRNAKLMADGILEELLDTLQDYSGFVTEEREKLQLRADGKEAEVPSREETDSSPVYSYETDDGEVEYDQSDYEYRSPLSKLGDLFKGKRRTSSDGEE